MSHLSLKGGGRLPYEHSQAPGGGCTFVFVNALTGDRSMWTGGIAQAIEQAGHGWLAYNLRGQADTAMPDGADYSTEAIVADLGALLEEVSPARPVLAGLSIGGLYALRAVLAGADVAGIVLINTLRRDGPRLKWVNDAIRRAAEVGGPELIRDLFAPLLFNEDWQAENRAQFLGDEGYVPIDRNGGIYGLLRDAGGADWDLPYEDVAVPVLVMTGEQDRVFRDAGDVVALTARLPNAKSVSFPDAGHMIPAERPEAFAKALTDFAGSL